MTLAARAVAAAQDYGIVALDPRRSRTLVEEDAQQYAAALGVKGLEWTVTGERAVAVGDGFTFDYSRRLFWRGRMWFDRFYVIRDCPTCGKPDAIALSGRGSLVTLGLILAIDRHPYHRKPWVA
jgi:hypothetical protein